jgi:integrase
MAGQINAWVSVMRGEGRFPHPPAGYERIHRYLYILWPVLTDWARAGLDLRQITTDRARTALMAQQGHQARGIHNALRSVFRALKQQRIVFTNPMTGLSLTTPVRLPAPLPSDRLHGALERLDTPSARLIVALVAIHGLKVVDVARLQLDDADLAHHTLAVRRRGGIHTVYLDQLTATLITAWLAERRERWPASPNTHLVITTHIAYHPAGPRLSYTGLRASTEDWVAAVRSAEQQAAHRSADHGAEYDHQQGSPEN